MDDLTQILVSVGVSVLITTLQRRVDLDKLRVELQQQYAKSLFDKRVDVYQDLFYLLSGYGKKIQYGQNTKENLIDLSAAIDDWNSHNALFFTQPTRKMSYKFRHFLRAILSNADVTITPDDWEAVHRMLLAFEDAIRTEIGILDTPAPGKLHTLNKVLLFADEKIRVSKGGSYKSMNPERFDDLV